MNSSREPASIRTHSAPACLLCGAEGTLLYAGLRDRLFSVPGVWELRGCRPCGLAWLDPRPLPEETGKLYEEYITHGVLKPPRGAWASFTEAFQRGVLSRGFGYQDLKGNSWGGILGQAFAWAGPWRDRVGGTVMWLEASCKGRLLDVGCGNGEFLVRMQDLGWQVAGIEPDPAAARVAHEKFQLQVAVGTLREAALPPEDFDAVTLNHVFEHVFDPVAFLRDCRCVLKKGGRLVLTTPNLDSLGHRWANRNWVGLDPPRHLFLMAPRALAECARRAGLRILELRSVARLASWMWVGSRQIQRTGRFSLAHLGNRGLRLWVEGLTVLAIEQLFLKRYSWGEEVLLIATRP